MESTKEAEHLKEQLDEIKANHSIKHGSPEHEAFLSSGYPKIKNRKHAAEIIAKYEGGSSLYPYEIYEQAQAFLEALDVDLSKFKPYHPPTDARGRILETPKTTGRRFARE